MAAIVFGVAGSLPEPWEPPTNPWVGLDMTWTGYDGTLWSLTNPSTGSVMLPGLRGWTMPPITHFKDEFASVDGTRWRGFNVGEREVFWPIQIYTNQSSQEWLAWDSAFWRTMNPGEVGTWRVIQPNGESRSLRLRFANDGTGEFQIDPAIRGWTNYGITLYAEQPFWAGDQIDSPLFDASAGSTPFYTSSPSVLAISPGNTLSEASILNPSDVPTWPIWTLTGPFTAASVSIGGKALTVPFSLSAGQKLVINTDPTAQTAMVGSTDRIMELSSRSFTPLPANSTVPLGISMTGTGTVSLSFTPLYYRAW